LDLNGIFLVTLSVFLGGAECWTLRKEKKMKTEYLEPSGMVEETSQSKQKTEEEE